MHVTCQRTSLAADLSDLKVANANARFTGREPVSLFSLSSTAIFDYPLIQDESHGFNLTIRIRILWFLPASNFVAFSLIRPFVRSPLWDFNPFGERRASEFSVANGIIKYAATRDLVFSYFINRLEILVPSKKLILMWIIIITTLWYVNCNVNWSNDLMLRWYWVRVLKKKKYRDLHNESWSKTGVHRCSYFCRLLSSV